MTTNRRRRVTDKSDEQVTPLELFFDLVFVYALTQVTTLLAEDLSGRGLMRGLVVLALVWWCWVGYSWLGNTIRADEGVARTAFIAVMAAMFIASLAIPESFDDLPGGLHGPMVFAACYGVVRYIHIALYAYAARSGGDRDLARTLLKFGSVATASIVCMVVGATQDPTTQLVLWGVAVAIDYVGTQLISAGGWRLYAPGHFSERHGLIVIIALGESIVSIGVGASSFPVSTPLVIAAGLGIVLTAMFWWVYFDVTSIAAEHRLAEAEGAERTALGRDAFSYLHLPMVGGVVFAALGLKKTLTYISGDDDHDWHDALHGIPLVAMHAGPALYLLALIGFRRRMVGTWGQSRPIAAALLLATIPLGTAVGTLLDLAIVTAIVTGLVAFEAIRFRETRHRIRYGHEIHPPHDH